ncbi:alpha/beta hydrolase [Pontibacter sp. SGAir0037]|uniref:alpha/beta hydrolase n=1 Tax=Pontibacter sp. SGAir0037 TaxID=2571030 RepID=UPI0010CD4F53|nr:alpha/beta hydrolase [Pontibacter sp. SGAir0037]QCR22558.1 alpha/beta hydrolase [Pontibacter sp. SGAir0037]
MRIFLIPGFGEDEAIFDKIAPHLSGKKIYLNPWVLLGNQPRPELNALLYAKELVKWFAIRPDDVLIGHSTGGWVALHIKHLVYCPVVQVSSWTESQKVVKHGTNKELAYWLTKKGLLFNRFTKNYLLRKNYKNTPSAPVFASVFERLIKGNKNNVNNQLRLILNPIHETIYVEPDLRIHARADTIVKYPDQQVQEVPGDHFALYTYPQHVYQPIVAFLKDIQI